MTIVERDAIRDGIRKYLRTTRHRPLLKGGCEHTWRNRMHPILADCDVASFAREVIRLIDEVAA